MLKKDNTQRALFEEDDLPLFDAISRAQFIAFAPYVYQASLILRDRNILKDLDDAPKGLTINEVAAKAELSHYATRVLLEAGLGIGLVYRKEGHYYLARTGHIFQNNKMTRINTDFMRDVCYQSAGDLLDSLEQGKPMGLKRYGDWDTIYEGLSTMPKEASNSWFTFDHFYSDNVFPEALPMIFERPTNKILDVGANTGNWAITCAAYNENVTVGIADLPEIIDIAKEKIDQTEYKDRISFYPMNILKPEAQLPSGYDTIWMSQFLACFADEQIIAIMKKCYDALPSNGRIFINDTFWNKQRFEAPAFSLQMTSLYFTNIANGNSQIYDSAVYMDIIDKTGFELVKEVDNVGRTHTILELHKK